jgi:hypothetical protein
VQVVTSFPLRLEGLGLELPGGASIEGVSGTNLWLEIGDPTQVHRVEDGGQREAPLSKRLVLVTTQGTLELVAFQAEEPTAARSWPPAVMKAIAAVRARDTDESRSVLADVLEESGNAVAAEYVRTEQALQRCPPSAPTFADQVRALHDLGRFTGPTFKYLVAREVEGCAGLRWSFRCSQDWESMTPTSSPAVRVCSSCRHPVTEVTSEEEAARLAAEGMCISMQDRAAPLQFTRGRMVPMKADPIEPYPGMPEAEFQALMNDRPASSVEAPAPKTPWWKRLFGDAKPPAGPSQAHTTGRRRR